MTDQCYLTIDQGTTNGKVLVVSTDGAILSKVSYPVGLSLPQPGWYEQDGEEMWSALCDAMGQALAQAGNVTVRGLALSVQRESVIAWDRTTTHALAPLIGWQDARSANIVERLLDPSLEERIRSITGLRPNPMFSAPKMRWVLDDLHRRKEDPDNVRLGTVDSFLVAKLTDGTRFITEVGCASRTLLLNIRTRMWSAELLELFEIPETVLAEVHDSTENLGTTRSVPGIPDGIPIRAVLGDSHAALFAESSGREGIAKATYGTGSSVMVCTGSLREISRTVSTTIGWSFHGPSYAREGNILAAGAGMDTLANILGVGHGRALDELAGNAAGSAGICVVPAFSGLGAPHWSSSAVGIITGLRRESTRAQVARAAVESTPHQVCDVLDAFAKSGSPIHELRADGGPSRSRLLMQSQADFAGIPVRVAETAELSALGVASLAMQADGFGPFPVPAETRVYEPQICEDERQSRRKNWKEALSRSIGA